MQIILSSFIDHQIATFKLTSNLARHSLVSHTSFVFMLKNIHCLLVRRRTVFTQRQITRNKSVTGLFRLYDSIHKLWFYSVELPQLN